MHLLFLCCFINWGISLNLITMCSELMASIQMEVYWQKLYKNVFSPMHAVMLTLVHAKHVMPHSVIVFPICLLHACVVCCWWCHATGMHILFKPHQICGGLQNLPQSTHHLFLHLSPCLFPNWCNLVYLSIFMF